MVYLAELAAGRSDLLARYAGLAVGVHEGELDEERYLRAAQMCIDAGADTSLIPHWIDRGRSRASAVAARQKARWPSALTSTRACVDEQLWQESDSCPGAPALRARQEERDGSPTGLSALRAWTLRREQADRTLGEAAGLH